METLPLLRAVLDQITRHRTTHNQSFFRHRNPAGHIEQCIGGWAITLSHRYRWIGNDCARFGQIQVEDLATGRIRFADTVATELLGLESDESIFVIGAADDKTARAWLEDQVAARERRAFDQLTTPLTIDTNGHLS
jgi:SpoVK/Ycf46/Vps4 family AAA+-type ATPase